MLVSTAAWALAAAASARAASIAYVTDMPVFSALVCPSTTVIQPPRCLMSSWKLLDLLLGWKLTAFFSRPRVHSRP
jgi:hypothetical protein